MYKVVYPVNALFKTFKASIADVQNIRIHALCRETRNNGRNYQFTSTGKHETLVVISVCMKQNSDDTRWAFATFLIIVFPPPPIKQ